MQYVEQLWNSKNTKFLWHTSLHQQWTQRHESKQ